MPKRHLNRWLRDLQADDLPTQESALLALANMGGEPALQAVTEALTRPFSLVRHPAADALMLFGGTAAAEVVVSALTRSGVGVRLIVLEALRKHFEATVRTSQPVRRRLALAAPRSSRTLHPTESIIKAVLMCTEDDDEHVRKQAAGVLRSMQQIVRRAPRPERRRAAEDDDDDDGGWSGSTVPVETDPSSMLEKEIAHAIQVVDEGSSRDERRADVAIYVEDTAQDTRLRQLPEAQALLVGTWYILRLALRVKPRGIPFSGSYQEPIRFTGASTGVTVLVAAESEGFEIEDPVQTLALPPRGDSTQDAYFRVRPLDSAGSRGQASIRMRLFYEMNLLESIVFQAAVVGKFDDPHMPPGSAPVAFRQERLEHRYEGLERVVPRALHIDILRHGPQYALHFVVPDPKGRPRMALQGVARIQASDLEDELSRARGLWNRIATSRPLTSSVDGDPDEFVAQVRSLAQLGEGLWTKLFRRDAESSMWAIGAWLETRPLPEGAIIQVSTAPEAQDFVFPWALLFDGPLPDMPYELPDPDGFWGLRYCIEQRIPTARPRQREASAAPSDPLLLGFFRCQRLNNVGLQDALLERLQAEYGDSLAISAPPLEEAEKCYRALEACESDILYFYTHGYTRMRQAAESASSDRVLDRFVEFLREQVDRDDPSSPRTERYREVLQEIESGTYPVDRSWIELTRNRLYLETLYSRVARLVSHPIVLLNMCESAQMTPSLAESFVHFFVDRGARAVLGTECYMSTEFAHPFASEMLARLLRGESIGDALRSSRNHFIRQNRNPLGLAYTLYGSGVARLRPKQSREVA